MSAEMASLLAKLIQKTLMDMRTQAITEGVASTAVAEVPQEAKEE